MEAKRSLLAAISRVRGRAWRIMLTLILTLPRRIAPPRSSAALSKRRGSVEMRRGSVDLGTPGSSAYRNLDPNAKPLPDPLTR